MTWTDWFNSTSCPWWINLIGLVFSVLMLYKLWAEAPIPRDRLLMFAWMIISAFVNFSKMLEKLAAGVTP